MNLDIRKSEAISETLAAQGKFCQEIIDILMQVGDNPKIERLGGPPRCFMVNWSDLSDVDWTPLYYDPIATRDILVCMVKTMTINAAAKLIKDIIKYKCATIEGHGRVHICPIVVGHIREHIEVSDRKQTYTP